MSKLQESIGKLTVPQLAESLRLMCIHELDELNVLKRIALALEGKLKPVSEKDAEGLRMIISRYENEPVWEARYLALKKAARILEIKLTRTDT